MDLLSMLAVVRRQTTLTSSGLTSNARFPARFSIAANAAPIAVAPGTCDRARLPVTRMMTPERALVIWRAAARAVIKRDLTMVVSGSMNSSTGRSTANLAVLFGERAGEIDEDIDFARLLHDIANELVDGSVIGAVDCNSVCPAARSRNFFCDCFNGRLRPARQKDFGSLHRKLFSDRGADRASSAEYDRVLSLENRFAIHVILLRFQSV